MTPPHLSTKLEGVTGITDCLVNLPCQASQQLDARFCIPATNQVETVASLPTRSRPETGRKPSPEEFGFKRRTAIMADSVIGRKDTDIYHFCIGPTVLLSRARHLSLLYSTRHNKVKCRPDVQGSPSPVQQRDLSGWGVRAKTIMAE